MAAEGGGNIVWFTYTGQEEIPDEATHIFIDVRVVPRRAFYEHPNIIEVICHESVEKIEEEAFRLCPSLRRVIMPGVKILEERAFNECTALEDILECGKLKIIKEYAFHSCESLRSINLPSVRIVQRSAFICCKALMEVKFGSKLERIVGSAFLLCTSLERITIPLKDGIFSSSDIFQFCQNLNHVDLVEGEVHKTIASLQLVFWRNDVNTEIDSINQILPNARAGGWVYGERDYVEPGEKALVIRRWIKSVLHCIIYYQAKHQRILDGVASAIELALPRDTVMNNILPFLELPSYTFDLEYEVIHEEDYDDGDEDEDEDEDDDDDESVERRHRCCCLRKLWPSR